MRIILIFIVSYFLSCSGSAIKNNHSTDINIHDTISKVEPYVNLLSVDTPKVIKAGRDYVTIAASPFDTLYFGKKFSPYKLEPYDILEIERVIDSLLISQKLNGTLKNKSLRDFKYQIFSVRTANQKIESRVQAICNDQADRLKWNSSRIEIQDGGDCFFSIIYDLIDKKIIAFQINGDG